MTLTTILGVLLGLTVLVSLILFYLIMRLLEQEERSQAEMKLKQEFIDRHLFVVTFPTKQYVFPFVSGTNQSKVFWCPESALPTPLWETQDINEVVDRVTRFHQGNVAQLEHQESRSKYA